MSKPEIDIYKSFCVNDFFASNHSILYQLLRDPVWSTYLPSAFRVTMFLTAKLQKHSHLPNFFLCLSRIGCPKSQPPALTTTTPCMLLMLNSCSSRTVSLDWCVHKSNCAIFLAYSTPIGDYQPAKICWRIALSVPVVGGSGIYVFMIYQSCS